jgi:peptidoglycan/xylan/chitin deacetylase (PgdA/CDA1 family)
VKREDRPFLVRSAFVGAALVLLASACGGGRRNESPTTGGRRSSSAPISTPAPATQAARPRPAHRVAPEPRARILAGRIADRLLTPRPVVALTFDAGANDAGAPKILATLAAAGVAATFFMTGRWAELYPQWARRIAARYPIGNHTFDHSDLTFLTHTAARREILMARAAIRQVTGRPPAPFFRFPYGASSSETLSIANQLGYTAVGWTVDTLGWEGTTAGQSVGSVIDHALGALSPGEIILMHVGSNPNDGSTLDADALATIIRDIRDRGYTFVALPGFLVPKVETSR